jgi:tRNA(adenine34) deaminase
MCAWAIIQSRIAKVVFGAHDAIYGALGTKIDLRQLANSNLKVVAGIKEEECQKLLNDYIKQMRKKDETAK